MGRQNGLCVRDFRQFIHDVHFLLVLVTLVSVLENVADLLHEYISRRQ